MKKETWVFIVVPGMKKANRLVSPDETGLGIDAKVAAENFIEPGKVKRGCAQNNLFC